LPTENDNALSPGSEDWELVIALDDTSGLSTSGDVTLHELARGDDYGSDILTSDDFFEGSGYIYREGQEVQYGGSADELAEGEWYIDEDMEFLRISIDATGDDYSFSDLNALGFHYTMTCANDVIEGRVPAPELSTVFLLGAGLIAVAGLGRKGLRKDK
jgi:hypothetical protein